jgi:phytoene dehydrogenase-like protein
MPSSSLSNDYDALIIGAGHNGLVAACYLAGAGKKVLVIEKNSVIGGASVSHRVFPDYDARLSRYAYLVSLFPRRIVEDLGLDLTLLRRSVASYTPQNGGQGLLISNQDPALSERNIRRFGDSEWDGYRRLMVKQQAFAELVWDSFLVPLQTRGQWQQVFHDHGAADLWREFVETPIGELIENHVTDDLLRGLLLTDAKIGANTHAHDPSLLQNRTYIYHIVGNKTGEWLVPEGGMGQLTGQLAERARGLGAGFLLESEVIETRHDGDRVTVIARRGEQSMELQCRHLLWNATPPFKRPPDPSGRDEGTAFKINMLLKKLPRLRDGTPAELAFAGTFHIDESYAQLAETFRAASAGQIPDPIAGEIYCHTLTDPGILSPDLQQAGYHTLTFFGLDLPYSLFEADNEGAKQIVLSRFLAGLNHHLETPIEDCLATGRDGRPCIEAKSSLDLERELDLPRGNIFHKGLSWFFAENDDEAGRFGVETEHPNVWICGSSAKRGGAVSGIPGRNAAIAVLRASEV